MRNRLTKTNRFFHLSHSALKLFRALLKLRKDGVVTE